MFKTHITNVYGETIYKKTLLLQKLKIRASSAKNRWIFLTRCVHHKVLPPSFKSRPVLNTRRGRDITFKYDLKMLQATAAEAKKSFHKLNSEIKLLSRELSIELAVDDHNVVTRITEKSRENAFLKLREKLKTKFERISGRRKVSEGQTMSSVVKSAVLNLTDKTVSDGQLSLLNLGPKFVPALKKAPVMDIITSTEIAAIELSKKTENIVDAERMRYDVSKLLTKYINVKLPSNLDRQQLQGSKDWTVTNGCNC